MDVRLEGVGWCSSGDDLECLLITWMRNDGS